MTSNNPQVPWTDEQWARVNQIIQEEASRARVAATFLPLYGPLSASTDFVRKETMAYRDVVRLETLESDGSSQEVRVRPNPRKERLEIEDKEVLLLSTLQVKVYLRGAQMADPDMTSALALFRRAANVLARLEDALVFNGQPGPDVGPARAVGPRAVWEVSGGQQWAGLLDSATESLDVTDGQSLVAKVSASIGKLEEKGHFGPFAVVLGQELFLLAQTPSEGSLALPQDCITPFLSGGQLLRSSALPDEKGVVIALGGAPVELVIAADVSLTFLQITTDPVFVFRVHEKMVLRIKEPDAIIRLVYRAPASRRKAG